MFIEEKPHRGNTLPLTSKCHHCSYHHLICDLLNRQRWPCSNCEDRGLWCVNSGWDTETEEIDNVPYVEPDFYIEFLKTIQDDPQLWYEQNFRRKNVLGPDGSIISRLGAPDPIDNGNNTTESLAKDVANCAAAPVGGIAPFAVAPPPQAAGVFGFPNFNFDMVNFSRDVAGGADGSISRGLGGRLEIDRAQQELENNFSSWNMNLTPRPKGKGFAHSPQRYNPIDEEIVLPEIDLDNWEELEAATRWLRKFYTLQIPQTTM